MSPRTILIREIASIAPVPIDIPIIIGDAVQNIRSTLDHLAHHLVQLGPAPIEKVYFPIGKSSKEFETRTDGIKQRLRSDAVKPLAEIKAYQGGSDEILWHLNELNNIDKHRLLLTVSAQNRFHSMSPREASDIARNFLGAEIDPALAPFVFLSERWNPLLDLKPRDILRRVPKAEVQENMQFPIDIAFGEPEVVKGYPVVVTLHRMCDRVRSIVNDFFHAGLFE